MSELCNLTLGGLLKRGAERSPTRTAIEYCGKAWTWGDVNRISDTIAKGLLAIGVKKGCHIGIISSDSPSLVLFMLGVYKIGGICVFFNPASGKSELEELIRFTDIEYIGAGNTYKENNLREFVGSLSELPLLKKIIYFGEDAASPELETLCKAGESVDINLYNEAQDLVKPEDVASLLFTSGTTGSPKAVMITHFSQVNTSIIQAEDLKANSEDKFCIGIPMFHCFCLSANIFSAIVVSGCICFPENMRTANIMKTLAESRCTIFNSVPSLFYALMARPDFKSYNISALRIGIIGGAGYTAEQFKSIEDNFGLTLIASLGMTEATGGITVTYTNDSFKVRSTTVGHFMKHVNGSICDINNGKELSIGKTGEICVSGFMVMKGYYKQPELTKLTIDEKGRLHSGDLGYIDNNCNLHVTGRIKELINRGGEKISPNQIEKCLLDNDSRIETVKVIGVPDTHYGEEICACVIMKKSESMKENEIRNIIRNELAKYKVPKYVLFYDEFPYNFKGKVTNKLLQETAIKKLKEQGVY